MAPPPRWLFYGCLATALLALACLIALALIYARVLRPGQRESAKNRLPALAPLLQYLDPPLPPPNLSLPTPLPANGENGAALLLDEPPVFLFTATATASATPAPPATIPHTPSPVATATTTVAPSAPTATATDEPAASLPDHVPPFTMIYQRQTWNNCGPANATMALSYYGWQDDQEFAEDYLKPGGREDKNVSPSEIVSFIENRSGLRAIARIGGDLELMRALLDAGFPVILEVGYRPEGHDWLGHYRTLAGYHHPSRQFFLYDSYIGPDDNNGIISQNYADLDEDWRHFNRVFIVVYEANREEQVHELLGERLDETQAAEWALAQALAEARAQPGNSFAYFNAGAALTLLGRHDEAVRYFDEARRGDIPWRMTWYRFTPYEAYFAAGRLVDLSALLESSLNAGGAYVEETYYWRGRLREAQGEISAARANYRTALSRNPRYEAAQQALAALDA